MCAIQDRLRSNPAKPYVPSSWGDRYFETQKDAKCGRHAINNLLGGPQFIDGDFEAACNQVVADTSDEHSYHSKANGWYSHQVLANALEMLVPPTCRLLYTPLPTDSYDHVAKKEDVLGALVNENNAHWTAIVKHLLSLWYVDSINGAKKLNKQSFIKLLEQHPNTFLVVTNDSPNFH